MVANLRKALRLGTRGSLLARTQSQWVADLLERRHGGLRVELHEIRTTGDRITDRPLHESGGKGLFTKELEQALLEGQIDFAVHSMKDVPVTMPLVEQAGLVIEAVPEREDPRDVLVSMGGRGISDLPEGAKVGTASLRRKCQLLASRPDLKIEMLRGNIDTRVRKLREGQYDAVILAMAGLRRTGLFDAQIMRPIEPEEMLPAAGQGALALQCRRDDEETRGVLAAVGDVAAQGAVTAERGVVSRLQGDCTSPIAVLGRFRGQDFALEAVVGARGGDGRVIRARASGHQGEAGIAVAAVVEKLEEQGVWDLLKRGES
jgi:hydroxymethylbilane synthase